VLPRHRIALTRALAFLESVRDQSALHAHKRALPHAELLAAEMREAAGAMGVLCGGTGSISPDEVLGKIFGAFCIGK
jgi:tRNA modification GTPase